MVLNHLAISKQTEKVNSTRTKKRYPGSNRNNAFDSYTAP